VRHGIREIKKRTFMPGGREGERKDKTALTATTSTTCKNLGGLLRKGKGRQRDSETNARKRGQIPQH